MPPRYDSTAGGEEEASEIGSKTASTVSFVLVGKLASFILAGIAFIIVARILGPGTYGIYTLALAVSGFFGSVGNFGVSTALNKFIPEYMYRKDRRSLESLLANGYLITLLAGVALAAVTMALSGTIAHLLFHNLSYSYFIDLAALSILSSLLFGASTSALLGFNNGAHVAAITGIEALFQSAISIALVLGGLGAAAPIIGIVAGQFIGFASSMYFIYVKNGIRALARPSVKEMKRIFRFSLPIAGSGLVQTVASNFSLIVLGAFATTVVVGNFGIASKTNSLIDIISGSISVSLLSMFSATVARRKSVRTVARLFNYTMYYALVLLAPILLFIAVLAKPFSYVAFSGVYTTAPLYILIMCVGLLAGLAGTYATTLLISASKVKEVFKYSAAVALIELALLPVAVPLFKGVGLAVLVYIVAPLVTDALFIWKSNKLFRLNFDFGKLCRISLANAVPLALLAPLMLLWGSNYILLLVTGAVEMLAVYPITLGLFRGIDSTDVKRIRRMTASIPFIGGAIGVLTGYAAAFLR